MTARDERAGNGRTGPRACEAPAQLVTAVFDQWAAAQIDADGGVHGCPSPGQLAALDQLRAFLVSGEHPSVQATSLLAVAIGHLARFRHMARDAPGPDEVWEVLPARCCVEHPAGDADRMLAALLSCQLNSGADRAAESLQVVVANASGREVWELLVSAGRAWGYVQRAGAAL